MPRLTALAVVAALLTGCQSIVTSYADSRATNAGKGTARVLLGIVTLGFSEIRMKRQARWTHSEELIRIGLTRSETLDDLIHLFGSVPTCERAGRGTHVCTWEIDTHLYWKHKRVNVGFGVFQRSVGPGERVAHVSCPIPTDGSPRTPESCTHTLSSGRIGPERALEPYGGELPAQIVYLETPAPDWVRIAASALLTGANECAGRIQRGLLGGQDTPMLNRVAEECASMVADEPVDALPPVGAAADDCSQRIADGIAAGLGGDQLQRVMDGCLAEHGR